MPNDVNRGMAHIDNGQPIVFAEPSGPVTTDELRGSIETAIGLHRVIRSGQTVPLVDAVMAQVAPVLARLRGERDTFQAALEHIRRRHHPRTDRHGSGCISCGRLWPCPDYRDAHALIGGQEAEPAPARTPPDDGRVTCEHADRQPRCKRDREGRCLMCCAHHHFRED